MDRYRKQQTGFADDDQPGEEIPPAQEVVEDEPDDSEVESSEPQASQVSAASVISAEEKDYADEVESELVKAKGREEDEDEFYVP